MFTWFTLPLLFTWFTVHTVHMVHTFHMVGPHYLLLFTWFTAFAVHLVHQFTWFTLATFAIHLVHCPYGSHDSRGPHYLCCSSGSLSIVMVHTVHIWFTLPLLFTWFTVHHDGSHDSHCLCCSPGSLSIQFTCSSKYVIMLL